MRSTEVCHRDQIQLDWRGTTLILSPPTRPAARIGFLPFATSPSLIETVLKREENQHHSWGVLELVQAGYEVEVFPRPRKLRVADAPLMRTLASRRHDLIYSNHNELVLTASLKRLNLIDVPLISLIYARETLWAPDANDCVLCLTPVARRRFAESHGEFAPLASWGIDLRSRLHEPLPITSSGVVSAGATGRDFGTLRKAAEIAEIPVTIAARGAKFAPSDYVVPVQGIVGPWDIRNLFAQSSCAAVILQEDNEGREAYGWTSMLEAMAYARPIIKTRTATLDELIDIEALGMGIYVEPNDAEQLASAIRSLAGDLERCRTMGKRAREILESMFSMDRFAETLLTQVQQALA